MPIIASANESKSFTPAPEGVHQAVAVDVIDLGYMDSTWQGKTSKKHKIDLVWQIEETRDDGKRFCLYKRYTLSLGEKANLRKDLESWRGKAFTATELAGFDVETIIGVNCLINVQHSTSADGSKTYANVVSVMPLIKGMPKLAAEGYVRQVKGEAGGDSQESPPDEDFGPITDADGPPF
jgi:hypothetical protein